VAPGNSGLAGLTPTAPEAGASTDGAPDDGKLDGPTDSPGAGSQDPFGTGRSPAAGGRATTAAEQQAHLQAQENARAKAKAAAEAEVARIRLRLEKVRAKHRVQRAEIATLNRRATRAQKRADRARREMGNLARAAYTSGDGDLTLLATLLAAKTPQDVLSGAGTAARIAGHREELWIREEALSAKVAQLAAEGQSILDRYASKLRQAKADLQDALALAAAVDVVIAPPKHVPAVDLTTKSDWVFPTATGQINSEAGMRLHPILRYVRCHAGADISAPAGTPIFAVDDGVVVSAGVNGGYGNFTLIAHGNGLTSGYAHQQLLLVKSGDIVTRGQLIGEVGTTGLSTGAHLHFEASHHGVPYNPRGWLENKPELRVPVCR
jgi:murein DD-endopeptidase MepM/ murein hydrolase activator NlpD